MVAPLYLHDGLGAVPIGAGKVEDHPAHVPGVPHMFVFVVM